MHKKAAIGIIAIFLLSIGSPLVEYGEEEKNTSEIFEDVTTHEKRSSSSNMAFNITGFQEGSVYSNQTVAFAGGAVCQIIDGEVWCDGVGMAYFTGYMFGNRSMVENWPDNPEFLGNVPDYDLLDEPYRIDMLPENRHVISIHRGNGGGSTCAVLDDGSLTCWGSGSQWIEKAQQDGFSTYTLPSLTLPNSQKIIAMDIGGWTVGGEFACVLTDRSYDNTYCFPMWDAYGNFSDVNQRGELGLGYVNASGTITTTLANHTYSALEMYGGKATSISAGWRHACAIVESTSVLQKTFKPMCWGDNNFGQVGNGSMNAESFPNYNSVSPTNASVGTLGLNAPMAMSLSHDFSCALLQKGDVSCWGGVLAEWVEDSDGNWGYSSDAYEVTLSNTMTGQAIALYTSQPQVCVLSSTGEANCWQREIDSSGYGKMNSTHSRIVNLNQNGVKPVTLQGADMYTSIQTDNRLRRICTLMENDTFSCYASDSDEPWVYTDEDDVWNGTVTNHWPLNNESFFFQERDSDGDGVPLFRDLCPNEAVPVIGCIDADGDGKPDQFENDSDNDGVPNSEDICPGGDDNVDSDSDGTPDDCDADRDGDGTPNDTDDFPDDSGEWKDSDGDGVGDNTDPFPDNPDEWSLDDADGDGVTDRLDAFPNDPTESVDSDGDGVGDNSDAFPNDPSEWLDLDGNGIGDNEDNDDDGDGIPDDVETRGLFTVENCPWRWYAVSELDYATYGANDPHRNFTSVDLLDAPWWRYDYENYRRVVEPATFLGTAEGDEQIKERSITTCDFSYDAFNDQDGDGITLGNYYSVSDPGGWNQFGDGDECVQGHHVAVTPVSMQTPRGPERPDDWYYGDSGWDSNAPNEIEWRLHRYCSNPLDPLSNDTDGDGLSDYDEIHAQQLCTSESHPIPLRTVRWGEQELTQWGRLCHTNPMVADSDGDGVTDGEDPFPTDPTQSVDADGDGYGDNMSGSRADLFLGDATEWFDFDGDGIGDNADPDDDNDNLTDISELENNTNPKNNDTDGDGFNDTIDDCPTQATIGFRWREAYAYEEETAGLDLTWIHANNPFVGCLDTDYDGFIDNIDECPSFPGKADILGIGCNDRDGDGYSDDNDLFPYNRTSWADTDEDGYSDDLDACIDDVGTSTSDRYGCPDRDKDGYSDHYDSAPDDSSVFLNEIGFAQRSLGYEETVYGAVWNYEGDRIIRYRQNYNYNCGLGSDHSIDQNNGVVAFFLSGGNNLSAFIDNTWYSSPTFDANHGGNFGKVVCVTGGGRPQVQIDDDGIIHGLFTSNSGSNSGLWYVKWDPMTNDLVQNRVSSGACKSCGIGLDVADGVVHIAWFEGREPFFTDHDYALNSNPEWVFANGFDAHANKVTGNYMYASSDDGEDWNKIKVASGRSYNGGIDVAVGQDGTIHLAFTRSHLLWDLNEDIRGRNPSVWKINGGGSNPSPHDVGLMYTKKSAAASQFEPEKALPVLADGDESWPYSGVLVVKAPRIVASQDSPTVHVASSKCNPVGIYIHSYSSKETTPCASSSFVMVYSTFNGEDWTKKAIGNSRSGSSFDLTLGPMANTWQDVHLVYTSVEHARGGNAKTVTYAKMVGIDDWRLTDLENANLAGVGITLDETNQPIIIHGYGDYDKLKRSQGKVGIYLTGWDEDGDGFANWEDDCLSEYGILNGCQDLEGDGILDSLSNSVRENPVGSILVVILVAFGVGVGVGVAVFRRSREFPEDMLGVDIQEFNEPYEQKSVVDIPSEEE
ncbi:hypothetical protein N9X52_01690 [Candidatus Poseidonia alphae]|nr:hypothetical protein [Candidatus Poseidonia alphae]